MAASRASNPASSPHSLLHASPRYQCSAVRSPERAIARAEEQRAGNQADHAQRKARQAIGRHDTLQEELLTSLQAQDDRRSLTEAWAWLNAARHASEDDDLGLAVRPPLSGEPTQEAEAPEESSGTDGDDHP